MAYDSTDFPIVTELPIIERDPKAMTDPRERLSYVSAYLRALPPERFDMRHFAISTKTEIEVKVSSLAHRCGTAGCVAGWTNAIFGGWRAGDTFYARDLLGLNYDDAEDLFFPTGFVGSWESITPAMAANVIDRYLTTGVVDWNGA